MSWLHYYALRAANGALGLTNRGLAAIADWHGRESPMVFDVACCSVCERSHRRGLIVNGAIVCGACLGWDKE